MVVRFLDELIKLDLSPIKIIKILVMKVKIKPKYKNFLLGDQNLKVIFMWFVIGKSKVIIFIT